MRTFGADFRRPLAQLREYIEVLRGALHEGTVEVSGEFIRARARFMTSPRTPVMASALQGGAFELCGELADGAITWVCPPDYVQQYGLPAMERGAASAGRPRPPIVLHVPVCRSTDRARVIQAASAMFGAYTQYQFYRDMFAAAGHPPSGEPRFSPELVDALILYGTDDEIRTRLFALGERFEHLMVSPIPTDDPAQAIRDGIQLLAEMPT